MDNPSILPKPRKNKLRKGQAAGPWISFRKTVQYLALFAFIALFVWSSQGGGAGNLINIPMRLDPLLMLANLLAARVFLAGSALAIIVVLLTVVFGRAWCGWLCPLGTVLDIFPLSRARTKRPAPSDGWRKVKFTLVIAIFVAALLGNLTLLFFDPLALFLRTLTVSLWPALDRIVTGLEAALTNVPFLADPLAVFDGWIRPAVLPSQPVFYQAGLLSAVVFLTVILLNLLAARFWCRYLCPLGGGLGWLSKLAIFRRQTPDCKGCTLCTEICPTGTINPAKDYASDPAECTMCLNCLEVCPRGLTSFVPVFSLEKKAEYDPSRREALLAIGATVASVALLKSDALAKRPSPWLIRPPGVRETNPDVVAFTKCTRCNECVRVCPTGGLQPAIFEAGLEGLGAPMLVPRLGYCDYSCNACGQACPVQAIPALALEQKRKTVIGLASIDQNHCIPWSDHQPCQVCEEMCPLPKKAIQLEKATAWGPDGTQVTVQLPHVLRDLCIGCGICEYKCPAAGQAAIRVSIPKVVAAF
jgi:polyferredoxin